MGLGPAPSTALLSLRHVGPCCGPLWWRNAYSSHLSPVYPRICPCLRMPKESHRSSAVSFFHSCNVGTLSSDERCSHVFIANCSVCLICVFVADKHDRPLESSLTSLSVTRRRKLVASYNLSVILIRNFEPHLTWCIRPPPSAFYTAISSEPTSVRQTNLQCLIA